jgi:hypothetical protein
LIRKYNNKMSVKVAVRVRPFNDREINMAMSENNE